MYLVANNPLKRKSGRRSSYDGYQASLNKDHVATDSIGNKLGHGMKAKLCVRIERRILTVLAAIPENDGDLLVGFAVG